MGKSDEIEELRKAVEKLHGCRAEHSAAVPVHERFQGKTVWNGAVQVFRLSGHPKATECFAWQHADGPADSATRFVAVLAIPPVTSPETAVRAAIVAEARRVRSN